jgi:hypothetical protein
MNEFELIAKLTHTLPANDSVVVGRAGQIDFVQDGCGG